MVCEILSYYVLVRYEPDYAVLFFSASGWSSFGEEQGHMWHHGRPLYTIVITED